jgi:molybdate transport system regulatory protein
MIMNFQLKNRFWIETEKGKFLGHGRIELLELIDKLGSINKAASSMNMGYRKAWELCQSMNEQAKSPLIIQKKGGKAGGGTLVTTEGKNAIQMYKNLDIAIQEFIHQASLTLNFD